MNKEKEIISTISRFLPRSSNQLNDLFESDSEILQFGGKNMLFTVDEYSSEDQFRDSDPYTLGWNLTVATISDILASGGTPRYYAHSMNIPVNKWNNKYLSHFSKGIADVLSTIQAGFIGGDVGTADKWHYTGVAIGESKTPVTRRGAKPGDLILMTGQIGIGNLEAALNLYSRKPVLKAILKGYKTKLAVRFDESRLIREFATSCIDSSDGVLNALNTLSDINNTGFEITQTPYFPGGLAVCKLLSKPKELLLAGECGEYELVFTINEKDLPLFCQSDDYRHLSFTPVGRITRQTERLLITAEKTIDFTDFDIRSRSYENISLYIEDLTKYLVNHEKFCHYI
ncbi:MAG: hypothetical protein JSV22_14380 [Bacteroidales bacterium]|nr:MAG: hypothetical protein JSV22_14380 [Bacteroidales bacterium]